MQSRTRSLKDTGTDEIAYRARWFSSSLFLVLIMMLGILAACDASEDDNVTDDPGSVDTPVTTAASTEQEADVERDEPLSVVVTMPFLPSMVDAVGGAHVETESIVPHGVDAHTYQPTPGDARLIADADVVFVNGLGLEEFLDDLVESAGGVDAPVYELADGLQREGIETGDHHHDDDHESDTDHSDDHHHADQQDDGHDDHDHDYESGNPHFWLSPAFGITYVENIYQGLSEIDPANETVYRSNADDYITELESLDEWAQEQMDRIPAENRYMVTFHDAFPHFATHYGLEVVGVIVSSPGREPGAREMADLVDQIRNVGVPAVFVEPQFNPQLAEAIADEAGVETVVIYSDAPPEGADYLEMLEMNVERVVEGLS